jgi:magnesium transporter
MNWHDIRDPNDPELDRLAERYDLHPLHIEDCRHRNQSAKVEEQGNYLFVVLKLMKIEEDLTLDVFDFDIFLGADYVITVQEGECPALRAALDKADAKKQQHRPDQLLYRIMDAAVDDYLPTLDHLNDQIDDAEDKVLTDPNPALLQRIFDMKRTLVEMRRVLTNMRDVTGHLQRTECDLIKPDLLPFLRDVYDHVARNLDIIETQRDIVNGSMDIYLSSVANRTNQVMKVLTIVGTVTLPAIIISSLYGMNVKGLPWADAPNGAVIVLALIVGTSVVLAVILRLFHWF